jgi:hypothetical protein
MARGKFSKHNKIIFAVWVDKTFDQSLIKQNIKVGFRATRKRSQTPKMHY